MCKFRQFMALLLLNFEILFGVQPLKEYLSLSQQLAVEEGGGYTHNQARLATILFLSKAKLSFGQARISQAIHSMGAYLERSWGHDSAIITEPELYSIIKRIAIDNKLDDLELPDFAPARRRVTFKYVQSDLSRSRPIFKLVNNKHIASDAITEKLSYFICRGVNVDELDQYKNTPLMMASMRGYGKIVELLLASGADVNACNRHGSTSLMRAVGWGHYAIAKLLLENGANVNAVDEFGNSALFSTASIEIARLLIDNGIDVNIVNQSGENVLTMAVIRGLELDFVSLIAGKVNSVNFVNKNGNTTLDLAVKWRRADIVNLLIGKSALSFRDIF